MENTLIQKLETDAQKRSISGEVVGLKALFLSQKEQIRRSSQQRLETQRSMGHS